MTTKPGRLLGAFELAQLWADRTAWPIDERTQYDELSELAVMSALGAWVRRWRPIAIHSAMLAGACPEAIMGALALTSTAEDRVYVSPIRDAAMPLTGTQIPWSAKQTEVTRQAVLDLCHVTAR